MPGGTVLAQLANILLFVDSLLHNKGVPGSWYRKAIVVPCNDMQEDVSFRGRSNANIKSRVSIHMHQFQQGN